MRLHDKQEPGNSYNSIVYTPLLSRWSLLKNIKIMNTRIFNLHVQQFILSFAVIMVII